MPPGADASAHGQKVSEGEQASKRCTIIPSPRGSKEAGDEPNAAGAESKGTERFPATELARGRTLGALARG
jgi:hypothetical protein